MSLIFCWQNLCKFLVLPIIVLARLPPTTLFIMPKKAAKKKEEDNIDYPQINERNLTCKYFIYEKDSRTSFKDGHNVCIIFMFASYWKFVA